MLLRVELVISLNMVANQQNPENQNSDIVASSSEAGIDWNSHFNLHIANNVTIKFTKVYY